MWIFFTFWALSLTLCTQWLTVLCLALVKFLSPEASEEKYTIKSEPIVSVIWNFEFQKEYGFYRNVTIKTGLTNLQKLDVFTSSQFSDLDLAPSVQNPRADALSILNLAKFFKTCMFYFGKKNSILGASAWIPIKTSTDKTYFSGLNIHVLTENMDFGWSHNDGQLTWIVPKSRIFSSPKMIRSPSMQEAWKLLFLHQQYRRLHTRTCTWGT